MGAIKEHFVQQLSQQFRDNLARARRAEADAREAAKHSATAAEKKEDGRMSIEFGSLATGHSARIRQIEQELEALATYTSGRVPNFGRRTPIALGAMVDLLTEDESETDGEERSFLLLPVGAGAELTGPNGDGFISVITPQSPIGKSLMGKVAGDGIDIAVKGEWRSFSIVDVS